MKAELMRYKITPSVVKADRESEIIIKSFDPRFYFYDDITYEVKFVPQDESDVPIGDELTLLGYEKNRKTYTVKPENGEIRLKYFFRGEQEWKIRISTKEYGKYANPLYEKYGEHWESLLTFPERGITLSLYSLYEDLYEREPLIGDLHTHTTVSDGSDSPGMCAAMYRKSGRDFVALTDHNVFNSARYVKDKLDFEGFEIMCGEEVHNGYVGYFHMVNIGGNYSVNEIYLNDPERVRREAAELEGTVPVPGGLDKNEYLNRVWLYREIKKSGGYAIFPHPYWNIGYSHTPTKMSRAVIKNGLCDAFEVMGGCSPKENNLQVALYNELTAEGCDIPIVASTDSHTVSEHKHTQYATVVFAGDDGVLGAVSEKYSVAVEKLVNENARVWGALRLASYTHFLLENYFPVHDDLCNVSGTLMCGYIKGDESLREDILRAEERIKKFKKEFFGR